MKHVKLIGTPAPEFDIAEVVNMPRVSWPELKGKVVLIDFWAVWCGLMTRCSAQLTCNGTGLL